MHEIARVRRRAARCAVVVGALAASALGAARLASPAQAAAAPTYTVTALAAPISYGPAQTPWGNLFSPTGVTSSGAVLYPLAGLLVNGSYVRPTNDTTPTAPDTQGSMVMLGVNDSSLVAGFLQANNSNSAAYWQYSATGSKYHLIDLSGVVPAGTTPGQSEATWVDDTGAIAGQVSYSGAGSSGTTFFYLSAPGAAPVAITDPGSAEPLTELRGLNSPWEVFQENNAEIRVNRTSGARDVVASAEPVAISARGTVLDPGHEIASDGSSVTLADPGGHGADATSISNGDIATGYDIGSAATAGVWDRTGAFTDLSTITGVIYNNVITGPSGRIVGLHYVASDEWDAYLLTPVRPPPPVVNSAGDAPATDNGANGCDTGATVHVGGSTEAECTLRAAIQAVDFADDGEAITFGAAKHADLTIRPQSALPPVTAAGTTIDFTTEVGTVSLIPDFSTSGVDVGVEVKATGVTIRGLYASGWARDVRLDAPGHDTVVASYLGRSPASTVGSSTGAGIEIDNSPANVVGGTTADDTDVISGNAVGVYIDGTAATGNRVQGDEIGTNLAGTKEQTNSVSVLVRDAGDNIIGGTTSAPGTGAGNMILGGGQGAGEAVVVVGVQAKASGNVIAGNMIGLDRAGTTTLPAACQNAITVAGSTLDTRIGGGSGEGNVISGKCDSEVSIDSTLTSGTLVEGNLVGTNAAGTAQVDLGSATVGIDVRGATHTSIGVPGEGNVVAGFPGELISGDPTSGAVTVSFPKATTVPGSKKTTKGATSTTIAGNTLGAVDNGTAFPDETATTGVELTGKGDLVQRNQIAGAVYGVLLKSATGTETVDGNKLGVDSTGARALDDVVDVLVEKSPHAVVGTPSHPNVMYGHGVGIAVEGSSDALVRSNHIGVTATGDTTIAAYRGTLPKDLDKDPKDARAGINVDSASDGASVDDNVVGGLGGPGILVTGAKHLELSGNHVGVGANKTSAVGNKGDGIELRATPAPVVGATLAGKGGLTVTGTGNLVAHNGKRGIVLTKVAHPRLLSNLLWHNGDGGVDATAGYPAPDAPALISAVNHGGHTNLDLRESEPDDGVLQVLQVPTCGGSPQAEALIDSQVLSSANKHTVKLTTQPVGTHLVANYTTPKRGTSEYSTCITVAASH